MTHAICICKSCPHGDQIQWNQKAAFSCSRRLRPENLAWNLLLLLLLLLMYSLSVQGDLLCSICASEWKWRSIYTEDCPCTVGVLQADRFRRLEPRGLCSASTVQGSLRTKGKPFGPHLQRQMWPPCLQAMNKPTLSGGSSLTRVRSVRASTQASRSFKWKRIHF